MAETRMVSVRSIALDQSNYRMLPRAGEDDAVRAMVSLDPVWFWALVRSLIENGYLPIENILVLESDTTPMKLVVKEGNRRIAAMKLILGILPRNVITIPGEIVKMLDTLPPDWALENRSVPCTVYSSAEKAKVERAIGLVHGKNEHAGRLEWEAASTARHNRDANHASEPALDLLEAYLHGNSSLQQDKIDRWAGKYPLTILTEAIQKMATLFGAANARELAGQYPLAVKNRDALDRILFDIGEGKVQFTDLRPITSTFLEHYGIQMVSTPGGTSSGQTSGGTSQSGGSPTANTGSSSTTGNQQSEQSSGPSAGSGSSPSTGSQQTGSGTGPKKTAAVVLYDPRAVKRALKGLKLMGQNRSKVVALRDEARRLDLKDNPIAFCLLLRSMFEVSAKAYCDDTKGSGGPSPRDKKGNDLPLVELLRQVTNHLTKNNQDKTMSKKLYGAITELAKPDGVLSVTSLNQLIHNTSFVLSVHDICVQFNNIFPLLEEMNR